MTKLEREITDAIVCGRVGVYSVEDDPAWPAVKRTDGKFTHYLQHDALHPGRWIVFDVWTMAPAGKTEDPLITMWAAEVCKYRKRVFRTDYGQA